MIQASALMIQLANGNEKCRLAIEEREKATELGLWYFRMVCGTLKRVVCYFEEGDVIL